jgi:hypothetical protein
MRCFEHIAARAVQNSFGHSAAAIQLPGDAVLLPGGPTQSSLEQAANIAGDIRITPSAIVGQTAATFRRLH